MITQITLTENHDSDRVSLLTEISNSPGALHDVLKHFWANNINLTHIESRPTKTDSTSFNVYIDFAGRCRYQCYPTKELSLMLIYEYVFMYYILFGACRSFKTLCNSYTHLMLMILIALII